MIVSIICLVLTLIYFLFEKLTKKKLSKDESTIRKIIIVIEVIGLVIGIRNLSDTTIDPEAGLIRNELGDGDYSEVVDVTSEDVEAEIDINVKEVAATKKQADKLLDKATEEMYDSILGDNKDADHIYTDLNLSSTYADGVVRAKYSFSSPLIDSGGVIDTDKVFEDEVCEASVSLTVSEYSRIEQFSFMIKPAKDGTKEAMIRDLKKYIEDQTSNAKAIKLPKTLGGKEVTYSIKEDRSGLYLSLLGFGLIFIIPIALKVKERQDHTLRLEQIRDDYPKIVSQLSLFFGAGISISESSRKINEAYRRRLAKGDAKTAGFAEWEIYCRELDDGVSEARALENLSERCEIPEFKRLCLQLIQSRSKGNDSLIQTLEAEEISAFELKKSIAKKKGEEASTKLLLPMFGMLAVVIMVLMVPAFTGMDF